MAEQQSYAAQEASRGGFTRGEDRTVSACRSSGERGRACSCENQPGVRKNLRAGAHSFKMPGGVMLFGGWAFLSVLVDTEPADLRFQCLTRYP